MQRLAKLSFSLSKYRNDGVRGTSIVFGHSHLCYMYYVSLQGHTRDKLSRYFFHCWCATGSSFPDSAQQSSLSLLVRCLKNSYSKILLWHKLARQSSTDHNCQIWFISLQALWRKCRLFISLWEIQLS